MDTEHVYIPESEEVHLRDYWKMLVKRRRVVMLVFLAVFVLGAYSTFSATPLYTGRAILRIEPQDPEITGMTEVLTPQAATSGPYDYYQTEFSLLKSRPLAAKVITELGLESNQAFTSIPVISSSLLDRLRSWFFDLLQTFFNLLRSVFTLFSNLLGPAPTPDEELSLKEKPPPIREFALGVRPSLIGRYLGFLTVVPVKNTRLVQVQFTTPDPHLSQELANAHASAFIRANLETRFELTGEAREFLEKKLSELNTKVERSEETLNRFRKKHGVVSLEKGENVAIERLVSFNSRLTEARARRIELEALYQIVKNRDPQYLSRVIDNNLIQELKSRLATLENEWARLSTTFKPEHPHLLELSKQISETRQRLNREIANAVRSIESEYATARAREEALQTDVEIQQQAALNLKELGIEYTVLQEEVDSNRLLYKSLLKRLHETNVSTDISVSNIQIVELAETPGSPSSPNTEFNLLLAAAFGLFFGVGLAFALEYFDLTVRTPEDVWRAVALPTFGVVPHLNFLHSQFYRYHRLPKRSFLSRLAHTRVIAGCSVSRELMISHHPLSIVSDSYRTIRTALLFSQPEKPPKVVLLTSPHPHDGKTVSTLNLAISLAQGGYKVLVIDGDLRKGNCHALLNRQNNRGLSNILTGSLALENGVQGTAVAGLAFLSRGVIPPNPPDLLGSHKMKEVLEMLRQDFDFVLLDSPPAIAVSDAAVLSTLCDGVVLVLRGQKTTLQAARLVVERLKAARARILGVVLNGIDIRNPDYADYRSYYRSYYAAVVKEKVGK
jgi:capsular exopolysaccharide synthesis family protein